MLMCKIYQVRAHTQSGCLRILFYIDNIKSGYGQIYKNQYQGFMKILNESVFFLNRNHIFDHVDLLENFLDDFGKLVC